MFNAKLKANLQFQLLQCDIFEFGTVDFSYFLTFCRTINESTLLRLQKMIIIQSTVV